MDFLDRVKSYIEANMDLSSFDKPTLSVGLLKSPNDIAIVPAPNMSPEKLLDLTRVYFFGFQIYARHQDQKRVIETCQTIELLLDGQQNNAILSTNASFDLIKIDCTTTTNFVEQTSEGYAYTALFDAELFI
jgi:hypothetical protein